MNEKKTAPKAPALEFKAQDMCSVIETCSKAGVLEIKWNGVEIKFVGGKKEEPQAFLQEALAVVGGTSKTQEELNEELKIKQAIEEEMDVVTNPLAWEERELADAR